MLYYAGACQLIGVNSIPDMTIMIPRLSRRVLWLALGELALILMFAAAAYAVATVQVQSRFRVVYSLDRRQNDQEIIRLVNSARRYVYFAVYYFTEPGIADALIRAKARGLDVRGITDREAVQTVESSRRILLRLTAAGIQVETQRHQDGIMHIKAVVTDRAYASGSYNWTSAATEANDEVLEIGTDGSVHDQYLSIMKKILTLNE